MRSLSIQTERFGVGMPLMLGAVALGLLGVSHGASLSDIDKIIVDLASLILAVTGLLALLKTRKTHSAIETVQATVNQGVQVATEGVKLAQDIQALQVDHLKRVEGAYQGFAEQGKATVAALEALANKGSSP